MFWFPLLGIASRSWISWWWSQSNSFVEQFFLKQQSLWYIIWYISNLQKIGKVRASKEGKLTHIEKSTWTKPLTGESHATSRPIIFLLVCRSYLTLNIVIDDVCLGLHLFKFKNRREKINPSYLFQLSNWNFSLIFASGSYENCPLFKQQMEAMVVKLFFFNSFSLLKR